MYPSIENTTALLQNLSEAYSVEVKSWFDPESVAGKVKLVRALLALRNNDGGRLVIGFRDGDMQPVADGRPKDVRASFSQDAIQALVTKYASQSFEIQVQYPELHGEAYPVVCVPSGLKSAVASRGEIKDPATQKVLLPIHAVFVRTMNSNNTVSTAIASWQDWPRLFDICFDNREADVGRFVRRHLGEHLLDNLATFFARVPAKDEPSSAQPATAWAAEGFAAFERRVAKDNTKLPKIGYFEFAAVIIGDVKSDLAANQNMLNLITSVNRRFGGYPYFSVLHGADNLDRRPRLVADGWEQAVIQLTNDGWGLRTVDFWRIEPSGRMYAIRGFDEDFDDKLRDSRSLAVVVPIWRTADAIVEALAIGRGFVGSVENSKLAVRLKWRDIEGRHLSSAYSNRFWSLSRVSYDDEAASDFELPLDLPDSAIGTRVAEVLQPLYRKFDGFELPENIAIEEVERFMSQRF